jgi:hypothetical protein
MIWLIDAGLKCAVNSTSMHSSARQMRAAPLTSAEAQAYLCGYYVALLDDAALGRAGRGHAQRSVRPQEPTAERYVHSSSARLKCVL